MTQAFFQRTGEQDFPDRLKVMITGSPKSGKTSFLGTVPNIVIADTEPHANNLQSIAHKNLPYKTITQSSDLQDLRMILGDRSLRTRAAEQLGLPDIEAVAIDTLDSLQHILKLERLKETRQSQLLRDDWGWMKETMTSIVQGFTALPLHVFFIVHTKTTQIGQGDDARTVVLPGLEGAIAESIAGMVGYSLHAFRKQEIRPDGSPYTKYWLRAEGDETYNYVGNRAAGRLPDIIEPTFQAIHGAALAGLTAAKAQATQTPVQTAAPVIHSAQISAGLTQAAQPAAPAVQPAQNPGPADDSGDPVNAAALTHIKKVFDAVGETLTDEVTARLTLGEARNLVRYWKAAQADELEGKLTEGQTAVGEMREWLTAMGFVAAPVPTTVETQAESPAETPAVAPVEAPEVITADLHGTIEQVLVYAGDDLARVQEAYDAELARQPRSRSTLLNTLLSRGAKHPVGDEEIRPSIQQETIQVPAPVAPVVELPTPVETAPTPVEAAPAPVTSPAPNADDPTAAALKLLESELGAVEIDGSGNPLQACEECNNPVDDIDIANLSRNLYSRWLCVSDYLAQTKVGRAS